MQVQAVVCESSLLHPALKGETYKTEPEFEGSSNLGGSTSLE